jgi:hypothetical protein
MVAGSILPIAYSKNKLYFLFGKENPMEDSSPGFSDFGGGVEHGETPFETALREGSEELSGFLGTKSDIRKMIKRNGGYHKLIHNDYHVHMVLVEYDPNLVSYYNANHRFLWDRMDKKMLNDSKLFEKIEIGWFILEEFASRRQEFRVFYREILDKIALDISGIKRFVREKGAIRKTKKLGQK